MALTDVRTYFREKLDALDYNEWTDGFNDENIPQSILDRSYHLEIGSIAGSSANQLTTVFLYPITVKIFLKGFVDPSGAIDDAILQSEAVLSSILNASDRLGADIKNITPDSIDILPLEASNDNDLILQMSFTSVIYCVFNN